jgi:hypothetical protein
MTRLDNFRAFIWTSSEAEKILLPVLSAAAF